MAHFAKLGVNGKVLSVEVVADADCQGADGTEMESIGVDFLNKTHGWPLWAKTSYNTRGGKYYNTYPSVLDDGQDPVVFTYQISWNEAGYQADNTKGWEATKSNDSADPKTIHDWNGSAWVAR